MTSSPAARRSFGSRLVRAIGWLVVAAGPLFLVLMVLGVVTQANVRSTGERVTAVVVDAQQGPSDWATVDYRFDGRTYREQLDTGAGRGDRVEVVVDPGDPTEVVLADGTLIGDLLGAWWALVITVALLAAGGGLLVWSDRPAPGTRRRGPHSVGDHPPAPRGADPVSSGRSDLVPPRRSDLVPSGRPLYSRLTLSVFPGGLLAVLWVVLTLAPWVPKAEGVGQQVVPQLVISLVVFTLVGALLVSPYIGLLLRVSVHPEGVFVSKWPGWFTACVPATEIAEVVVVPRTAPLLGAGALAESPWLMGAQGLGRVLGPDGVYRRLSRLSTVNTKFRPRDMVLVVPSSARPALLLDGRDPRLVEALRSLAPGPR